MSRTINGNSNAISSTINSKSPAAAANKATMDAISEKRLSEVHPRLAERVRSMAEILAGEHITIRVTQSLRSWSEQQALWLEGRDAKGRVVDPKKVVTDAQPGDSWHQFGLAVDVCPMNDGMPDWNLSHPVWKRIVEVGESVGLISGSTWRSFPDWPHFQMTGQLPDEPDDAVRSVFMAGGIEAVWRDSLLES